MWECNYAREPLDLKLLILRLMQKIWILILAAFLGAAVFGGGYYIKHIAFAGPDKFEKTSIYYVDYDREPVTGDAFTYINAYTWNEWVRTDEFLNRVLAQLGEEGSGLTKVQLQQSFSADLPSDLRMPNSKVTVTEEELAETLGKALEQAFVTFGESQPDIKEIRVVDSGAVVPVQLDDRTGRAVILGALLGGFFALTVLLIWMLLDDSVYLASTFTYRYGVPGLGVLCKKKKSGKVYEDPFLAENIRKVLAGKKEVLLVGAQPDTDPEAAAGVLSDVAANKVSGEKYSFCPAKDLWQHPEAVGELRQAEGVLLVITCGAHGGKRIEKLLDYLKLQEISVDGAVLWQGDSFLNRCYICPGFQGRMEKQ